METIWLSISAGTGPEECAHAAALTLEVLVKDIQNRGGEMRIRIIEAEPSPVKGNIRSALLALEGEGVKAAADSWTGVIQWVWRSTYRPHHKRKNWFVSIKTYLEPIPGEEFSPRDVRFETARAGGPGGQYVNRTESAVRAIHIPTGKTVLAREERSQRMNKKLALARLAALWQEEQEDKEKQSQAARRHLHYELERGNPLRIYDGDTKRLIQMGNSPKGTAHD